jgi:hypothetical protein
VGCCGLDSSGTLQGRMADCFEHGNEPSGYLKDRVFLDQLSDC